MATPAAMASYPAVTCSCSTRKNSTARGRRTPGSVIRLAAVNTRERNIDSGAIAPGRCSSTTNAAERRDATSDARPTTTAAPGGRARRSAGRSSTPSATTPASAPSYVEAARCASSSRDSGIRMPSSSTSAHSGRLIAKIQRQPACSTRKPPRKGPMATAMPDDARPGADRGRPVLLAERRLDDRQGTGREQGRGDALQHPEHDQLDRRLGERAQRAADGEAGDADQVDAPAAEPVPERAADQDQRGEAQQVAVGHPLQLREGGAEVGADAAQRDVDDRAVEHGDARSRA